MQTLLDSVTAEWENLVRLAPRPVAALLVVVASILVGRLLSRGVGRLLDRGGLSRIQRDFFRRATVWAVALFGIATAFNLLGLKAAATGLLAGGGITAVILGFAFREIGENFLAGFFLAFSRPFKIGDLIQSGDFKGTVRGIEMRHTHIRSADGRDIHIPNAQILNTPLVNFTRDGLLRPSFTVGIDYADDAHRACAELLAEVREIAEVADEPAPTVTIAGLEATVVLLEVAFWIDTFKPGVSLPQVRTEVMERCRRRLRQAGFTLSSEVSTSVALAPRSPFEVHLRPGKDPGPPE